MKIKTFYIFLFLALFSYSCSYKKNVLPIKQKLSWRYNDTAQLGSWSHAIVPGSIYQSLINDMFLNKNLYFDHYLQKISWLSDKIWIYRANFSYKDEITKRKNIYLVLNGVDTYSKIYINGKYVGQTYDFYQKYKFNITPWIHKGNNQIIVKFLPPVREAKKFYKSLNYSVPAGYLSIIRKPLFHLFPEYSANYDPIGFSKSVYIEAWNKVKINDIQFYTKKLTKKAAIITCKVNIRAVKETKARINIESQFAHYLNKKIKLKPGDNKFSFQFKIDSPQLWYPKGYGEQNLYKFTTKLFIDKNLYDQQTTEYGLRKIKITTKNNKFHLYVNDTLVRLRAVELRPLDVELSLEQDKYKKLFTILENANINTIVTWDKGHYFLQDFYKLCDQKGLLVIQSFMLPIKILPPKDTVTEIIKTEITQTVRELRHHPSIIAWLANYDEQKTKLVLKKLYPPKKFDQLLGFSNLLFQALIPQIIKENDQRSYLLNLNYKNIWIFYPKYVSLPQTKSIQQIIGVKPFEQSLDLLKLYTKPDSTNLRNIVTIIKKYNNQDLQNLTYLSQIQQAQELENSFNHIITQGKKDNYLITWFNDITPVVISPSAISSINDLKAQYYEIKHIYSPFTITIKNHAQYLTVNIYSTKDTASLLNYYKLYDTRGNLLWQKINKQHITNHKFSTKFDLGVYFKLFSRDTLVFKVETYNNLNLVAEKYFYFNRDFKNLLQNPDIQAKIYPIDLGFALEITPKKYLAKNIDIKTSNSGLTPFDNFIDILPGETKTIIIHSPYQVQNVQNYINLFSLYEAINLKPIPKNKPQIKKQNSSGIPNFNQ